MARAKPPTARDDAAPDDVPARPARQSNREHKLEVAAFSSMASTLVEMAPHKLDDVPLDDEVRREVVACRPFRKNARIRQLRRIAGLLRQTDFEALKVAVADAAVGSSARRRQDRAVERWRTRLLEDGDEALGAFVTEFPHADRQQLRQRVRAAKRDPGSGKSKQAARALLQGVRAVLASAPTRPEPDGDDPSPDDDDPSASQPPSSDA